MPTKAELIEQLRKHLRDEANKVGKHDSDDVHKQALERLWSLALEIADEHVMVALEIVTEAVKSERQPGETEADCRARLGGIPSKAFGTAGVYAGVDKPQHFFQLATITYKTNFEDAGKAIGRLYEMFDGLRKMVGKDTGGYDIGDIHADDLGVEFGSSLVKSPTTHVGLFLRHPDETQVDALIRLNGRINGAPSGVPIIVASAESSPSLTTNVEEEMREGDEKVEHEWPGDSIGVDEVDETVIVAEASTSNSTTLHEDVEEANSDIGLIEVAQNNTTDGVENSVEEGEDEEGEADYTWVPPEGGAKEDMGTTPGTDVEGSSNDTNDDDSTNGEKGYTPPDINSIELLTFDEAIRMLTIKVWSTRRPTPDADSIGFNTPKVMLEKTPGFGVYDPIQDPIDTTPVKPPARPEPEVDPDL